MFIFCESFLPLTASLKFGGGQQQQLQQQWRQHGSGVVRPGPMKALPLNTLVTNAAHLQEHLKSAGTGSGEFVWLYLRLFKNLGSSFAITDLQLVNTPHVFCGYPYC